MPAPASPARSGRARAALATLATVVVLLTALLAAGPSLVASRLRAAAAARGLSAGWSTLRLRPPFAATISGLALVDARGDTALNARVLDVSIEPLSLLTLSPRPDRFRLAGARIALDRLRRHAAGEEDVVEAAPRPRRGRPRRDHLPALRRAAGRVVRILTLPADRLPRVELEEVAIGAAGDCTGPGRSVSFDMLRIDRSPRGTRLRARGRAELESDVSFTAAIDYGRDERLAGAVEFLLPPAAGGAPETLRVGLAARLAQERSPHGLRVAEGSTVTLGRIPLRVAGVLSEAGPRLAVEIAADSVGAAGVRASFPRSMLGPLAEVGVTGTFDYRLRFDLDLARPDSVDFDADVVPHHLALTSRVPDSQSSSPWEVADPAPGRARLRLAGLAEPFVATIRLPRGRTATRELSAANPHYLPLTWIDGHLVNAVVTNEDGGFYLHRGFSTGAVREAIVENLRAGAYRRGAGTITMQLARNLFLGHDRSLSRKAQEVVLAWILEHLTGVEKRRLLEIYLNIVEWGPGIHGADEAARFYFGHGASTVTVDEALFLAVLLPSPLRWRGRLEKDGSLRPWTRAQMHFIGRAMIAKGWLDPAGLPAADSLRVRIAGPALAILAPAPPPADTLATQALEGRETRDEAPAD